MVCMFILHVAYLMSLLGTDILKGDPLGLLDITDEVCIATGCYANDVMHVAGCERPRWAGFYWSKEEQGNTHSDVDIRGISGNLICVGLILAYDSC